jgi:iron complex outermembrane receptor protein
MINLLGDLFIRSISIIRGAHLLRLGTHKKLFFLTFASNILLLSCWGQNHFRGRTIDKNGQPLPGVLVELHEIHKGTYTDSLGQFVFRGLKPGKYHIHLQLNGYTSFAANIELGDEGLDTLFVMEASALEVAGILVEAEITKMQTQEQSLTVETLNEEALQKRLSPHFLFTLSRLPGINCINLGVSIAKPVIRGLSQNRVLVLESGIKQEGQQWGNDHGLEIDPLGIHQIEVIKGPASLIYGSDAIGGVILLKPPPEPSEKTLETSALSSFMSLNNGFSNSVMLGGERNGFSARLRFTAQDYADYQVPAESFRYNRFVLPIYNQKLKNTAGQERHFSMHLGLHKKWGMLHALLSRYHQKVGLFAGAIGIPRAFSLMPDKSARNIELPYFDTQHTKVIVNGNILLKASWLEFDLGIQQNIRGEFSKPHAHGRPLTVTDNQAIRLSLTTGALNLRYHFYIRKQWHNILGVNIQAQQNRYQGFEFILPHFSNAQIGVFGYTKYTPQKNWIWNAGVRADIAYLNISPYRDPVFENGNEAIQRKFQNLCWSGGVSYFPLPELNFKLNAASAFRFPTPNELAMDGMHHGFFRHEKGASSLEPERGYQLDFSAQWEKESILLRLSPFFNYFHSYIYLNPTGYFSILPGATQIYQYQQAPVIISGGEISLELHPQKNIHLALLGEYLYTYNRNTSRPLPFIPPNSVLLEGEYVFRQIQSARWKNLFINLDVRIVGDQNRVAQNEWPTSGYTLWNFSCGAEWRGKKNGIKLIFQAQNLFDRWYLAHLSRFRQLNVPEAGRNFVFTLSYIFRGYWYKTKFSPSE